MQSKPGKGTTFIIKLARAEAQKAALPVKNGTGTTSYRLLLVEDELEILNLLRDMLRLKGHRVVAMSDGEKALELIDSSHFDLVLTDLGMPVVSGWEIAKRTKSKNPKTPVVMITGWGAQYEDTELTSRGVDLDARKTFELGQAAEFDRKAALRAGSPLDSSKNLAMCFVRLQSIFKENNSFASHACQNFRKLHVSSIIRAVVTRTAAAALTFQKNP